MTGPGVKIISPVFWLYMFMPTMSDGSRSGVNCTRTMPQPSTAERAFTSVVLPTPGMSSISTCPPANRLVSTRRICSPLPMMALPHSASICSARWRSSVKSIVTPPRFHKVPLYYI